MARGWESKSVEMQIEEANNPAEGVGANSVEDVRLRSRREGLMLHRSRILQEIGSARNPRYLKMLEETLAHLELELQSLPQE